MSDDRMLHDIVGSDFFVRLVDVFYDGVVADPVLIVLYPEGSDTAAARHRLATFLIQYFGGPHDYMNERGHPMLRARHAPFVIGERERDHWLMHMASAIESLVEEIGEPDKDGVVGELARYMVNAAEHLRNS